MAASIRDGRGRFSKPIKPKRRKRSTVFTDHDYFDKDNSENVHSIGNRVEIDSKLNENWKEGRRIVEFGFLLENLRFCKGCGLGPVPLTYYNVVGEKKKGLGGFLYVRCDNVDCEYVNCVAYGKTHHIKKRGMPCFAANTKLGTAMIDSVGGPNRVNNFLSTLNMPTISNANLKKMENRAGENIEKISVNSSAKAAKDAFKQEMEDLSHMESDQAKESMSDIIEDLGISAMTDASPHTKEVLRTVNVGMNPDIDQWTDDDDDDSPSDKKQTPRKRSRQHTVSSRAKSVSSRAKQRLLEKYQCRTRTGMSCSVDTAWQKRGYDSLTSHTFFMSKSKYGKKVLKSIVSHRVCGTCNWWSRNRKGQKVRPHQCVRNHRGSAKLMESVSGEQGIKEMQQEGTPVEYVEGDGDNTLIARVRNNMNIDLKKRFDKNHVVKNVGKQLYNLHHSKNVKLSKVTIAHLQKCLKYVLAKNAGNKEGLRENLQAIVPHQFADHTLCHPRFCGYIRSNEERYKYVHRSLPYKAPLKDEQLQAALKTIFKPLADNAEQYVDLGSSQACEHANREVALRAPKTFHYGNTKSLDYRVHATAACINEGRKYIAEVNAEIGLSPGIHTLSYAEKCQKTRKRVDAKMKLPSFKRRRLELKQERIVNQSAQEVLEGVSYQSGVGHESDADIEEIPAPVAKGNFKPVCLKEPAFVSFDLETTDLIRGQHLPQITQIAAYDMNGSRTFSQYVLPTEPIAPGARQVTGLSVDGDILLHQGKKVEATDIKTALERFSVWLNKKPSNVLIAHNGRRFDFPILVNELLLTGVYDTFAEFCKGFVDSLALFRKFLPGRKSYKQEDLVHDVMNSQYDAHDALEDAIALGKLVKHLDIESDNILNHSFDVNSVQNNMLFNREKAKNLPTLSVLVCSQVCKTPTAENIAGSGLKLRHLELIYKRDGEDGLTNTFIMKNSEGQPRVTSAKRILESVVPKLVDFFKKK